MATEGKQVTELLSGGCPIRSACVGRGKTSPDVEEPVSQASADPRMGDTITRHLFNQFSLLKSTAFRMGVTFWLLFTACFGLSEYVFYKALESRVMSRIDQSISERFADVQSVYTTDGLDAVAGIANAQTRSPMASTMGFHLSSEQGERLAGNVPVSIERTGWSTLTGQQMGLADDQTLYRFYTDVVDGNVLSVGKSLDALVELREIAVYCLLWTAILSTLLALVAAWFFARRVHCRVSTISASLDGVAAGNLNARLPVSCAQDDIDEFAIKINTSLDRLRQTVDSMRQVSTDIAHDLKTPLNRLFITIEDAATKSRAGRCVGDELDGALDEAQAINGTFEALLRIAQIEAGARRAQFKHIDLAAVLETATEVYGPVVEENNQMLSMDVPDQSLPMFGDQSLLMQLTVNLIENAVHHCSAGTEIVLSAGRDGERIWFRVADTGLGIPDAEREKVFQRLYRLERSRTTTGTGLGLSLVKAIADLHCGTVTLGDNHPGLTVTVTFDRNCPFDT